MPNTRLATLKQMVADNPNDGFSRYGLAMEHANEGELEQANAEFTALLQAHPNYAAGYYHGGRTLERLGRVEEARKLYQKGIQVTTVMGDTHTSSELQAALDLLG